MNRDQKLKESIEALEHALSFKDKIHTDPFYFSGISKAFEVCFEYAWKYIKGEADTAGVEAFSPRDAIKIGGQLGIIDDVSLWLDFLKDRNLAVHDYLGVDDNEYLETIEKFLKEVRKIRSSN